MRLFAVFIWDKFGKYKKNAVIDLLFYLKYYILIVMFKNYFEKGESMTGTKTNKLKSFLTFLLVLLLSVSLAFAAACSKQEDEEDDTTYSKTETDEQEITNGNFEFGLSSVDPEDYPYTSVSGWSRAVDNSASSSKVDTGVVDTEKDAFDAMMDELLANSTFLDWAKNEYKTRLDAEATEEKAKEELGADADSEAVEEWIEEKTNEIVKEEFKNPGTHDGAEGSNVLMLNNYVSTLGKGTAQKVTSSTSITLTPDTYGKVSVWVNTGSLKPANNVGDENYGANIRLSNTISSVTQDEYSISNIVTDGVWTQYTFYVKANDFLDSTIKVVLGLGYGSGKSANSDNYVEGTVYFDDVVYEELESLPDGVTFDDADKAVIKDESSSEKTEATVTENVAKYDMNTDYFYSAMSDFAIEAKQTTSNTGASNVPSSATYTETKNADGFKVEQSKNSTSVKVTKADGSNFTVEPDSYAAFSFNLSMTVDKLQRTGLTVYMHDVYGSDVNHQKALDNVIIEEDGVYTVIVKNNFKNTDEEPDKYQAREFYLEFIFGPINVATTTDTSLYTTGSYTVSNLLYQSGSLDEDKYSEDAEDETNLNYYNVYSLISNASGNGKTFSLSAYAGWKNDYTDEEEEETYSFTAAYSDKGRIETAPAKVSNYTGMEYYLTTYSSASYNPTAGLINTKYLANYTIDGLEAALDYDGKEGESAQPLMIYNETAGAYGFASEAQTLAASSYATVSVRVRVTGKAVAYVYLVDTMRGENMLKPLNHAFKGDDGKDYSNDLAVKVTADMMSKDDWATVNFYVASGKDEMSYRVELWNGERVASSEVTDTVKSTGFVFFDSVSIGTSFDESTVLSDAVKNVVIEESDKVYYTRPLTEKEIEYNAEQTDDDDKISYSAGVVWATNLNADGSFDRNTDEIFVYAVYNTINPVESTLTTDDDESDSSSGSGCANIDHSTFWLSLSSLLLGIALLVAIVMLIVKAVIRRRKARKSDAKAQYKITSRNKTNAAVRAKKEQAAKAPVKEELDEVPEEKPEEEKEEYTYGEVLEDFGDDEPENDTVEEIDEPETIEENIEIKTEEENKDEDNKE